MIGHFEISAQKPDLLNVCLALNYAAFGIKLLKLIGYRD